MSRKKNRKIVVLSGVNFSEGGPLSVMTDALMSLSKNLSKTHKIIALVNSKKLYNIPEIEFIEFPKSKRSWLHRLYYEFFVFKSISKRISPDYWLSMHDITPNVKCNNRFVYWHNPAPFFKPKFADIKYGFTTFLFSIFYKYLYKINIGKNKNIIVQQDWLRAAFKKRWGLNNIIVCYPEFSDSHVSNNNLFEEKKQHKTLFYPSFPRSFKNFELVCKAYTILPVLEQEKLRIYLTIDASLNRYAKDIVDRYSHLKGLNFLGILTRDKVFEYYEEVDGLVFPSRLETWGLPITEFKSYNKTMLLADLPYSHENVGNYDKAFFFNPDSAEELSKLYKDFVNDNLLFQAHKEKPVETPFLKGWDDLFEEIFND